MAPFFSLFFFLFSCRFSILAFLTMANRRTSTFARRRHTSASRGRRCVSSGGGWSTPGWLAPEALVGKLQRSLPRFISRLRASISTLRSIFSPALHPPSSLLRPSSFHSFARSLSLFREGLISLLSRIQCGKWTEFAKLGDPDSADSPPQRS